MVNKYGNKSNLKVWTLLQAMIDTEVQTEPGR